MAGPRVPTVTLPSGAEMPMLGLGTWQLDVDDAAERVRHALEIGYPLIDTAVDYYTQSDIGEAVRDGPAPREEVFLISKVEEDEDAYEGTRERLEELGLDRLDLCLIHRPPSRGSGEELWDGLIRARRDGLARDIGVSNYTSGQIDRLIEVSGETPAVNQIEWTPFGFDDALLRHARERGVVVQAYSPLTRAKRLDDETVAEIAGAHGKAPAQVLLRWDLQSGVATVPKAADREHQQANLDIFDFELDAREIERLAALNDHWSSLAGLPYV